MTTDPRPTLAEMKEGRCGLCGKYRSQHGSGIDSHAFQREGER